MHGAFVEPCCLQLCLNVGCQADCCSHHASTCVHTTQDNVAYDVMGHTFFFEDGEGLLVLTSLPGRLCGSAGHHSHAGVLPDNSEGVLYSQLALASTAKCAARKWSL